MWVAKVKLDNIRGFHDARKVDLELAAGPGWTVVTGPNGSGRTTLLQAIALAIGGPGFAPAVVTPSWVTTGRDRSGIEIDLVRDELDVFARGFPAPQENVFADLVLTEDGVSSFESNVGRNGPWQDSPPGWYCAAYGAHRRPGRPQGHRLAGLFRPDSGLAEAASPAALALINDGLLPEGHTAVADGESVAVEAHGHRIALRDLGDARRGLIALAIDLVRQIPRMAPGVVLIDEVDAHLNLQGQQWVAGWFTSRFPQAQFIVSTNSPYVCQAAVPGGMISLAGPPRVIEGDLYERVVNGSGEDVALSELFGLDSPYSPRARRLREELVELELRVLDGQASEIQVARYRELQELLVSSPTARAMEIAARLQRDKARRGPR